MSYLFAGFIGGLLRGGIGLVKYLTAYKNVEVRPWYFFGMVVLSGIVGYVSAWVAFDVARVFLDLPVLPMSFAIVAGYAGGDLIENLAKIIFRETSFYKIGSELKAISSKVKRSK